jgi:enolase-phosphatase E1
VTAAAVLDIEGTTSPTAAVAGRLFPYARERLAEHLRRPDPRVAGVLADVRQATGRPGATPDELAEVLSDWMDRDLKVPALKTLQGLIWADGFAAGELVGHVYPDVPAALGRWREAGVALHVYSSGSVLAQQLWFRHTGHGDLSGSFDRHFDTRTAGPKKEAGSYRRITAALGVPAADTVFLSDVRAELDAARAAGWATVGVRRAGEPPADLGDHVVIGSFAELHLGPHLPPRVRSVEGSAR